MPPTGAKTKCLTQCILLVIIYYKLNGGAMVSTGFHRLRAACRGSQVTPSILPGKAFTCQQLLFRGLNSWPPFPRGVPVAPWGRTQRAGRLHSTSRWTDETSGLLARRQLVHGRPVSENQIVDYARRRTVCGDSGTRVRLPPPPPSSDPWPALSGPRLGVEGPGEST